jgi:hypothetical protein
MSNSFDPETGTAPRLGFHRVPEPKTVKNRLHLDLITDDFDREKQRLIDLGDLHGLRRQRIRPHCRVRADLSDRRIVGMPAHERTNVADCGPILTLTRRGGKVRY